MGIVNILWSNDDTAKLVGPTRKTSLDSSKTLNPTVLKLQLFPADLLAIFFVLVQLSSVWLVLTTKSSKIRSQKRNCYLICNYGQWTSFLVNAVLHQKRVEILVGRAIFGRLWWLCNNQICRNTQNSLMESFPDWFFLAFKTVQRRSNRGVLN